MEEINIAVVDDNNFDSRRLVHAVKKFFDESGLNLDLKIEIFNNGEEILERFEPGNFQIVFMDIIMKDLTGIETAEKLRGFDNEVLIVFTTTSRDFAFDAFPIHSFDYILKPYAQERINYVMNEALKILSAHDPFINVRVSRSSYKIPLKNISAVHSNDHNVELVMINGQSMLCSMTFKEFQTMLADEERFLECNRGVIINMDCVMSMSKDRDAFIMQNGTRYPIHVRQHRKIIDLFTQYQILKLRRTANEL